MQIGFEKTVYDDVTTPKPVCSKSKKNTIVHKKTSSTINITMRILD